MEDFPGGPVVETLSSNAGGAGLILALGPKTLLCLVAEKLKHNTEALL